MYYRPSCRTLLLFRVVPRVSIRRITYAHRSTITFRAICSQLSNHRLLNNSIPRRTRSKRTVVIVTNSLAEVKLEIRRFVGKVTLPRRVAYATKSYRTSCISRFLKINSGKTGQVLNKTCRAMCDAIGGATNTVALCSKTRCRIISEGAFIASTRAPETQAAPRVIPVASTLMASRIGPRPLLKPVTYCKKEDANAGIGSESSFTFARRNMSK